jgi:uncharacterized damage-inducible protein DinB
VLQACQNLSEDQLEAMIPSAYGTIRDTLGHIIRAEAHYLRLLTGSCPQPLFKWEDRPSLAEMTAYAAQVGEALVDMAQRTLPTYQVVEGEATSFGIKRWLCSSRLSITASSIAQISRQSSIKVC